MLNLGGIDNRPPKANQSMGRFRVARNVYPTPDNRIIPRYYHETPALQPVRVRAYHHITQYNEDALSVVSRDYANTGAGTEVYQIYRNTTLVPGCPAGSPFQTIYQGINHSVMSFRRNNTTYFMLPEFSNNGATLTKYDGVQMWNMGVPQPLISVAGGVLTGSTYLRVIQHSIDFDNNEPASEYVEYTIAPAASTILNGAGQFATNMITAGRAEEPKAIITPTGKQYLYYRGVSAYNVGTLDYTITTTDTNITDLNIGEYVMVAWYDGQIPSSGLTGFGLALKIKSVSPLTLDATNSKYLNGNREWIDYAPALTAMGTDLTMGTQSFISVWRSVSKTGVYYYTTFAPSFPYSAVTFPISVDTSPLTSAEAGSTLNIITLGPILNDIYDTNTRKLSPNSAYPFGLNHGIYCMTNFQDLMLLASDDLIWFSDTTLMGSYEQLNTSSFIRVGDTEYGRITSICGTQDFLFVSRERKNYYVTGNITTGNYRVQEIIEAEIGAWSNNASILIKDSVIFITAIGVFQVVGGGKATKLSDTCPKNFASYDALAVNEDVVFRMNGFVSDITNASIDGISVAYDEYRELLVFMKRGETGNPSLVCHTKTGEFYEWNGLFTGVANADCIGFIQAEYYIGQVDNAASYAAKYAVENNTLPLTYPTTYPVKLYSSWLTAGEPSLEKELLQLKLFGRIQSNATTSSIKIVHFKDWDYFTKITNVEYFPNNTALSLNNQIQYSHKKRLNSDKVLSASVGIELTTSSVSFEIESFEVEFNPIQSGMKK